jgi:hypothetical protein
MDSSGKTGQATKVINLEKLTLEYVIVAFEKEYICNYWKDFKK